MPKRIKPQYRIEPITRYAHLGDGESLYRVNAYVIIHKGIEIRMPMSYMIDAGDELFFADSAMELLSAYKDKLAKRIRARK